MAVPTSLWAGTRALAPARSFHHKVPAPMSRPEAGSGSAVARRPPTPVLRVGKAVLPVSDRISLPNLVGRKATERSLPLLKPTTSRHQLPPCGETRQLGEAKRIV